MSPLCAFCSTPTTTYILPPDFIDEPITEGEHRGKRMCHFCKAKSNVLIGHDGTVYKKDEVCAEYKKFCDEVYYKPEIYTKFNRSLIDDALATKG